MVRICPSILAADFRALRAELDKVRGADLVHIDVMDGHFVPNISYGMPIAKAVKQATDLPLDIHLMIEQPESFIPQFAQLEPEYITVHYETCPHLNRTIQQIRELNVKPGVALNPHTPLEGLRYVIDQIDLLLIMTVNPGFGGQSFLPEMVTKIKDARKMISRETTEIQVDGGIHLGNVRDVIEAGATIVVAGSAIFEHENPDEYIDMLRS